MIEPSFSGSLERPPQRAAKLSDLPFRPLRRGACSIIPTNALGGEQVPVALRMLAQEFGEGLGLVAGEAEVDVAYHIHLAGGDGCVGGDPTFYLPVGAPLGAREARASSRVSSW